MFINATGFYIPSQRVSNDYFLEISGLTRDWIFKRTGIESRSKVTEDETGVEMGIEAVKRAMENLPYSTKDIDAIVSAGYTPIDTVGTLAHVVQKEFEMKNAMSLMVSSACSSFVNALEIIEGYFASGKAEKALIVCSEQNSYYSNEADQQSGYLWGDAAVAMFISKEKQAENEPEILNITSRGLGHVGKGPKGVYLSLKDKGLVMPDGRDVFINATKYMIDAITTVTSRIGITPKDLDYLIAHQANIRIVNNVLHQLDFPEEKSLNNIQNYGNTGSASAFLVMMEHQQKFQKGSYVGITVFGGGYSSGAVLIRF
ncbi:MAG: ketoacyl-ACP synthase III [Bacteroidales bacterium]|jgi:3-oxoacyl-[acyl-carrier-protein] synthase-3|nr:ketoacyl-ACP synthase III [Bacteroidales bacterium]